MLTTIIAGAVFIALVITMMAIGSIVKGKPIKGSCGGMAAAGIDGACGICGRTDGPCEREE